MAKLFSRILGSLFLLAAVSLNSAHAAESVARDLKDIMADMGTVAKAISKQIANKEMNSDSASKSEKLRGLVLEAAPIEPEKVAGIPDSAARKAEFLEYQKQMGALSDLCSALQQDFLTNNNDQATKVFSQVRAAQKAGHDRFRIPE